jgi:hypothetical protein
VNLTRLSLAAIAGAALAALVACSTPAPLTGDQYADAACTALVSSALENGQYSQGKLTTLTDDERAAIIREVSAQAARSEFPDIRGGADHLAAAELAGGNLGFVMGLVPLGEACKAHGWSPQAAGLIDS